MKFSMTAIGTVHSPFKSRGDIPPPRPFDHTGFDAVKGELILFPEYIEGLEDTEGFSHLFVLFAFHASVGFRLKVTPPFDDSPRGLFATRSPHRPNPIGMTIVRLLERRADRLLVSGLDMIDGTPILDIKPYTPRDRKEDIEIGWLEETPDAPPA